MEWTHGRRREGERALLRNPAFNFRTRGRVPSSGSLSPERLWNKITLTLTVSGTFIVVQSLSHVRRCDSVDYSTPGFPVLHYLLEFAQIHVHWVRDAVWPSHSLPPPSPFVSVFPASGSFCFFTSGGQSIELQHHLRDIEALIQEKCVLWLLTAVDVYRKVEVGHSAAFWWTLRGHSSLTHDAAASCWCSDATQGFQGPHGVDSWRQWLEEQGSGFQTKVFKAEPRWEHSGQLWPRVIALIRDPPANTGDRGSIPGIGKIPWRRKWQPTAVFLPGKSHGQRSWWAAAHGIAIESDTT